MSVVYYVLGVIALVLIHRGAFEHQWVYYAVSLAYIVLFIRYMMIMRGYKNIKSAPFGEILFGILLFGVNAPLMLIPPLLKIEGCMTMFTSIDILLFGIYSFYKEMRRASGR